MEEIKDLKTSIAIQTVEYEELEIQNIGMKRDIANLDDKLEEAYLETRNLKADLGKINDEKNKRIEEINSKDVQNACIKDELENSRRKIKNLEKVNGTPWTLGIISLTIIKYFKDGQRAL